MATVEQCRSALDTLAKRLAAADDATRRMALDRTLTCTIRDLDVTFAGRLSDGELRDIHHVPAADVPGLAADVRMSTSSDDLIRLVDGELAMAAAWATGRVRIDASVRDLLRLRKIF